MGFLGSYQLAPSQPARRSGGLGQGPGKFGFCSIWGPQKSCQNAHCLRSNIASHCYYCSDEQKSVSGTVTWSVHKLSRMNNSHPQTRYCLLSADSESVTGWVINLLELNLVMFLYHLITDNEKKHWKRNFFCCSVLFYTEISASIPEPRDFRPKPWDFGSNPESWQP